MPSAKPSTDKTVQDVLQPVTADNTAVKFNGNSATIEAAFKQIDEWSERTGVAREWILNRAERVGKGILAIDSAATSSPVPFIRGEYVDETPPTAARPAKPSAARYTEYEAYTTRTAGMTPPAGPTTRAVCRTALIS